MIDLQRAVWVISSHSAPTGDNCVEAALNLGAVVAIRDSKNRSGHIIAVTPAEWRRFTAHVRQHH